jgi:phosphomannomutase
MPVQFPPDLIASVSGFRGRVGAPLTPELIASLASGFGAWLAQSHPAPIVVVGRDSRTSGPVFYRAAVAGLLSVGCRVIELGVVPTPTIMMAVRHHGANGGIGVTASHNPAEWNALKLASGEGMFLDAGASLAFREFVTSAEFPRAPWDRILTVDQDPGAIERHHDAILALPFLDLKAIRARGFKVALDCVHGAGGRMVPGLLEALGCQVVGMGLEPDGRFPRDPEPTAANLAPLGALVRSSGADLGFAVDPDADRLSLVDETGSPLGEDHTLALASAAVLKRESGTVVTNLSTSRVVQDVAEGCGGTLVRAAVGEINVARKMQEVGAVIGGEGNGGVILPALHHTRDAPLGCALLLQHLVDEGGTLSEAAGRWPRYRILKEKVQFPRERLAAAYAGLEADLDAPDADREDGLRLDWPQRGRWLHVRPSGTEPIVRLIAVAPSDEDAAELIGQARTVLARVLSGPAHAGPTHPRD